MKIVFVVLGSLAEMFFVVLTALFKILGLFLKLNSVQSSSTKKTPILLVKGWFSNTPQYYFLKKHLESLGYKVYFPDFGLHLSKIDSISKKIKTYLDDHGLDEIILVGHSMGGIIGLNLFQKYDVKIKEFVSIASPFQGSSHLAIFSWTPALLDMKSGSEIIKRINKGKKPREFYSLSPIYDQMVSKKSTYIDGSKHVIVPVIGHNRPLYSKEYFSILERILR